jgi:hypothetical protein
VLGAFPGSSPPGGGLGDESDDDYYPPQYPPPRPQPPGRRGEGRGEGGGDRRGEHSTYSDGGLHVDGFDFSVGDGQSFNGHLAADRDGRGVAVMSPLLQHMEEGGRNGCGASAASTAVGSAVLSAGAGTGAGVKEGEVAVISGVAPAGGAAAVGPMGERSGGLSSARYGPGRVVSVPPQYQVCMWVW